MSLTHGGCPRCFPCFNKPAYNVANMYSTYTHTCTHFVCFCHCPAPRSPREPALCPQVGPLCCLLQPPAGLEPPACFWLQAKCSATEPMMLYNDKCAEHRLCNKHANTHTHTHTHQNNLLMQRPFFRSLPRPVCRSNQHAQTARANGCEPLAGLCYHTYLTLLGK